MRTLTRKGLKQQSAMQLLVTCPELEIKTLHQYVLSVLNVNNKETKQHYVLENWGIKT